MKITTRKRIKSKSKRRTSRARRMGPTPVLTLTLTLALALALNPLPHLTLHLALSLVGRCRALRAQALHVRLVQALVFGAGVQQLLMRAGRGDAAAVYHDDAVGDLQGVQAMGDDEGGPVAHEIAECLMDQRLAFDVGLAGEFVQDEDVGVAEN